MAIALSQIQSPVDSATDPNTPTQTTQPVTKPQALPLTPPAGGGGWTAPINAAINAAGPTTSTGGQIGAALPLSTLPAGTAAPSPSGWMDSINSAVQGATNSVTPTTPIATMPYTSQPTGGTVTPPPTGPDAPPPAPSTAAPTSGGLPAGFTQGDPNSADWGSNYYNGQKVSGASQNPDGSYTINLNDASGHATAQTTQISAADYAAMMGGADQAYMGSAGKPGYNYESALEPTNTYTSPEVRALLQNPEWQAAYGAGPMYLSQFSPETQKLIQAVPNLYNNLLKSGNAPAGTQSFAGITTQAIDPRYQSSGAASGANTANGIPAPTGPANDVGTPSSGLGALMAQLGAGGQGGSPTPGGPATGAGTPSSGLGTMLSQLGMGQGQGGQANNGGVNLTPTTPGNALTNQTISPGPATDRFKIAQDQYDAAQQASQPGYEASLRDANRQAFGAGRGVSGQLRTSLGDLASNRATQLDSERRGFLDNALTGSIDDAYKNLGIAQQQQGFQNTQQQEAFGNAIQQALAQEQLVNGAFGRSTAQEQAGYANDPSQIALILSQIFGSQATGAGNAASGLFNQQGQGSGGSNDALLQYLLSHLGVGGSGGGAAGGASGGAAPPGPDGQVYG